ncbi:hypothetical protein VTK26DRAFT_3244 [Humicola hyalothermophila]
MQLRALALALLASPLALATPITRDVRQALYTLRLSSSTPSLDGRYLSAAGSDGTLVGVYDDDKAAAPVRFYVVTNPSTGLSELRAVSDDGGDSTAALALLGSNDLFDFASVVDPAEVNVPDGATLDWTSFELAEGKGEDGDVDGGNEVLYAPPRGSKEGSWVAFPTGGRGEWSVKWKGVEAITTGNYMPVKVLYELIE